MEPNKANIIPFKISTPKTESEKILDELTEILLRIQTKSKQGKDDVTQN